MGSVVREHGNGCEHWLFMMSTTGDVQLRQFSAGFYECLSRWADALFELADAVLCAPAPLHSKTALRLEPEFRRCHGNDGVFANVVNSVLSDQLNPV